MENLYAKLYNLYPVQKTLKFELIPIGETKENIEKDGILNQDEYKAKIVITQAEEILDLYLKLTKSR